MSPPPEFDPANARRALRRGVLSAIAATGALGLGVLVLARTDVGADAVADLLSRMHPGWLALAWSLISLAFVFMALRWRALMPPPPPGQAPPGIPGLTAIICAGLLLNYAVPGPFGEFGAAWFAHRRYKVPLAPALASGVAARVVGLATSALAAGAIYLLIPLPIPAGYERVVGVAAAVTTFGGGSLAVLALRPTWWKAISSATLGRLPPTRLTTGLQGVLETLADALADVAGAGAWAWSRAVVWAMAGHGVVILGILVAAHGLEAPHDIAGLAFTYATTTAAAVALFALPGSQVGWDAIFVTLMVGTAGLPLPDALAIGLLVRVQQLSFMVIGAGAVAWLLRRPAPPVSPPPS